MQKFIIWCDKIMVFSFCAMIYFLPISIALLETFTGIALFFYLLKRLLIFVKDVREGVLNLSAYSLWNKLCAFLKYFKPISSFLNRPIAFLLFVNFISVLTSQYQGESIRGFLGKVLQSAFIYFNFIECFNSMKRLRIFLGFLIVSVTLIAINGLYQFFIGHEFIFGEALQDGRITSSFRSANDLGAYFVFMMPIIFVLMIFHVHNLKDNSSQEKKICLYTKAMGLFGLFIISSVCLGFSYSRGAWFAFVVSLLLFIKNRKIALPALSLILVFFVVFYPNILKTRWQMKDTKTFLLNTSGRVTYWQEAANIIKDYPWFGSGLNTYSLVGAEYKINWGGYPHNCYLQMAAETGLIGLAAFFWIIFTLFRTAIRKSLEVHNTYLHSLLLGCLIGLLGFLIHGFFDTFFYSVQLGSLLWIVLGLIVAILNIDAKESSRH